MAVSVPAGASVPAPPHVSVVVPYYRAQADLDRLTAALAAQDHPASRLQLVVADDGSPEPPRLASGLPFETAVVRQEDRGFRAAAARALGVRAAEGEVLAFLDGDMLPEPGYLTAALAARAAAPADGGPGDAVVVGRRRHVRASAVERGWLPGHPLGAEDVLEEPAWLRDAYAASGDLARADSTSYRFVISAVLTVARDVYEDAGGFDPAFVGYGGEDWELAHRLWRVGAALRHAPGAVAWQAGEDFAGRTDAREAAELKAREALVLASRISATTARGHGLSLAGPARVAATVRVPGSGTVAGCGTGGGATAAAGSALGAAGGVGTETEAEARPGVDAATVVGVDALLQALPGARVRVVGGLGEAARAALADPRVDVSGQPEDGGEAARLPRRGDLAGVRRVPDWAVDVRVPLRPAGRGERPDARAVADWLLRLERAGVERVEVLGEAGDTVQAPAAGPESEAATGPAGSEGASASVALPAGPRPTLAVLTSSRARWRARRGGTPRTWRVPASRLGWAPVAETPDLEAWWGGWG